MVVPIFDPTHPRLVEITFTSITSTHSWDSQIWSSMTRLAMPIFHCTHSNTFWSTFTLFEFVSICKKIRLFHWFVLKIWLIKKSCNLIDWEHFGPYLRNKNFSRIWGLCRNTANNVSFHYRTNSVKTNDLVLL